MAARRLSGTTLSTRFKGSWKHLALDLETATDRVGPADAAAPSPETVAAIVAAGGAERDATQWRETHRVRPDLPALVVGGRRRAGAARPGSRGGHTDRKSTRLNSSH